MPYAGPNFHELELLDAVRFVSNSPRARRRECAWLTADDRSGASPCVRSQVLAALGRHRDDARHAFLRVTAGNQRVDDF